jgi:hypothetical protein
MVEREAFESRFCFGVAAPMEHKGNHSAHGLATTHNVRTH